MANKPKRITLLDIRKVETKRGVVPKVQLSKDVEIFYQGKKVDFGQYNSAFLKTKEELLNDINFLYEKEYISEEQKLDREKFLEEKKITGKLEMSIED
jgi:hypothetical protein